MKILDKCEKTKKSGPALKNIIGSEQSVRKFKVKE